MTALSSQSPDHPTALIASFDALVCDLDGVVYHGPVPIHDAVLALQQVVESGRRIIYATNNASRTPQEVAEQLAAFHLKLVDDDVITSSVAGAHVLAAQVPAGSAVLAVGGEGVSAALAERGLSPLTAAMSAEMSKAAESPGRRVADDDVVAVLQGYGPAVTAADLAEVAYAVQRGARWVATNTDQTLPTERGMAPGNGSLVGAVRLAVDVEPEVVGKPEPTMYRLAAERLGMPTDRVLAIGDRLETDIEGAIAAGMPSLLVFTGVHGPVDLLRATPQQRPDFVVSSLATLREPYVAPQRVGHGWSCGEAAGSTSRQTAGRGRIPGASVGVHTEGGATTSQSSGSEPTPVETMGFRLEGEGDERIRVGLAVLWEAIDHGSLSVDDAVRLWRSNVA